MESNRYFTKDTGGVPELDPYHNSTTPLAVTVALVYISLSRFLGISFPCRLFNPNPARSTIPRREIKLEVVANYASAWGLSNERKFDLHNTAWPRTWERGSWVATHHVTGVHFHFHDEFQNASLLHEETLSETKDRDAVNHLNLTVILKWKKAKTFWKRRNIYCDDDDKLPINKIKVKYQWPIMLSGIEIPL